MERSTSHLNTGYVNERDIKAFTTIKMLCCIASKENKFRRKKNPKQPGENEGPQGPISFQTQAKLKKT